MVALYYFVLNSYSTRSIWANTKSKVLLKHKKHQCSTTQSCFQSLLRVRKNKKREIERERSIYIVLEFGPKAFSMHY